MGVFLGKLFDQYYVLIQRVNELDICKKNKKSNL